MRNARGLFTVQVRSELRECLNLWLDTVALKTESKHTVCVYGQVVLRFLEYLEARGIDTLDTVEPCHVRAYLLERVLEVRIYTAFTPNSHKRSTFWRHRTPLFDGVGRPPFGGASHGLAVHNQGAGVGSLP
jgi:hypothetical protein